MELRLILNPDRGRDRERQAASSDQRGGQARPYSFRRRGHDPVRLEDHGAPAGLSNLPRCAQAGDAPADHGNIDVEIGGQ